mmetsp:Transcript_50409/g.76720  ORF Transcript_50409/g.76720 Transcript_50409/m.76720 type:complete len:274 (-) Transcript_50409:215-1036(-)
MLPPLAFHPYPKLPVRIEIRRHVTVPILHKEQLELVPSFRPCRFVGVPYKAYHIQDLLSCVRKRISFALCFQFVLISLTLDPLGQLRVQGEYIGYVAMPVRLLEIQQLLQSCVPFFTLVAMEIIGTALTIRGAILRHIVGLSFFFSASRWGGQEGNLAVAPAVGDIRENFCRLQQRSLLQATFVRQEVYNIIHDFISVAVAGYFNRTLLREVVPFAYHDANRCRLWNCLQEVLVVVVEKGCIVIHDVNRIEIKDRKLGQIAVVREVNGGWLWQ